MLTNSLNSESLKQIKDPLHVKYVLGINVNLNESFNNDTLNLIIERQLIFENFLDSLKKYLGDSFNKIVDVIKSPFDIAILIKNLITNPKLLESVLNTYKSKLDSFKDNFKKTLLSLSDSLEKIIEKIKSIPVDLLKKSGLVLDKIVNFYKSIVDKISKYFNATIDFIQSKIGDGWLGLLKYIISSGVLNYVSDKVNGYIKIIKKPLDNINDPQKFLKDVTDGEVKNNVDEIGSGLDSSVKDTFNGLSGVKETIDSITSFFSGIIKSKNWLWKYVVEYLSKIASTVKSKIQSIDTKSGGKLDLTHYGRLERDMKKIQDQHLRHKIGKIIEEQKNILNKSDIYNKNKNMSKFNKLIKEGLNTLLETKGFEEMEVAFGTKKDSDLSKEEKNQFGPMGNLKDQKGGNITTQEVNGLKTVNKSNKTNGSDAETYYKEVLKKVKDFQTPNDKEKFDAPKVDTNTKNEDERLEVTGYDVGVSGMEVVADLAAEKGGSEGVKTKYKERIKSDDPTAEKMMKNAKKTNDLKYKKQANNTRPVNAQKTPQPIGESNLSGDSSKLIKAYKQFVSDKYPNLIKNIDQPKEKAEVIAAFASEFGINPSQLGRVKSILDKQTSEDKNQEKNTQPMGENVEYKGVDAKNIFKANGKLVSEEQVLKLANKVPSRVKIDETAFAITDGENTYRLIWEGDDKNGEAIITNHKNSTLVKEDIEKMKRLWGFKSSDSISTKKNITESGEDAFKRMFKKIKEDK